MTNFTCLVCGYPDMNNPPADYEICPCCGTEFGLDDQFYTHKELREKWIGNGCMWFDDSMPEPVDYNPKKQLINLAKYGINSR